MQCILKYDPVVRECINNSFQVEGKILFSRIEGDGHSGKGILIAMYVGCDNCLSTSNNLERTMQSYENKSSTIKPYII